MICGWRRGSLWAMTAYHARFSNAGRRGRCRSSPRGRGGAPPPRIARPLRVGDARAVAVEGRARRTARVAPSSRCRGRRRARGGAGRKERGELHVAHVGAHRHQGRGAAPAGRAELAARHGRDVSASLPPLGRQDVQRARAAAAGHAARGAVGNERGRAVRSPTGCGASAPTASGRRRATRGASAMTTCKRRTKRSRFGASCKWERRTRSRRRTSTRRCASSLDSTRDASWKKKTLTAAFPDDDAAAGAVHPVHGATRPHDRYGCARLQNGRRGGI